MQNLQVVYKIIISENLLIKTLIKQQNIFQNLINMINLI